MNRNIASRECLGHLSHPSTPLRPSPSAVYRSQTRFLNSQIQPGRDDVVCQLSSFSRNCDLITTLLSLYRDVCSRPEAAGDDISDISCGGYRVLHRDQYFIAIYQVDFEEKKQNYNGGVAESKTRTIVPSKNKKPTNWWGQAKRRATKIRLEAVRGGIFDSFVVTFYPARLQSRPVCMSL